MAEKTRTRKSLRIRSFLGLTIFITFWFILAWILGGSVLPKQTFSTGWGILAAVMNIIMIFVMISLSISLLKNVFKFIKNAFAFREKNIFGKILMPVLGIAAAVFTALVLILSVVWIIVISKDALFNFDQGFDGWLSRNFVAAGTYYTGGEGFIGSTTTGQLIALNSSAGPLFICVFVFGILSCAVGIVYIIINKILSKRDKSEAPVATS